MEKGLVRWCSQESLLPQSSSPWGRCPSCSANQDTKWANDHTLEANALTETFPLSLHLVSYQGAEAEAENHEGLKGAMNQHCWLG